MPSLQRDKKGLSIVNKYYILEEQVKGRALFLGALGNAYQVCKDLCSKSKFNSTINNPYYDDKLYAEIVNNYIKDYILMNHTIEMMSDAELEKFIFTIYNMYDKGSYSVPDLYSANILFNENKLTLIDNALNFKEIDNYYSKNSAEDLTLAGLLYMFSHNMHVSDIKDRPFFFYDNLSQKTVGLINENSLICEEAILRVLNVSKKCLGDPRVANKKLMGQIYKMLKFIMGKSKAENIVKMIEPKQ